MTDLLDIGSRRRDEVNGADPMPRLAHRVLGEYREMPGLRLTVRQAARLFGVAPEVASAVLQELRQAAILARSEDGTFFVHSEARQP